MLVLAHRSRRLDFRGDFVQVGAVGVEVREENSTARMDTNPCIYKVDHTKRSRASSIVRNTASGNIYRKSISVSFNIVLIIAGSWVPSKRNTKPLSVKDSTDHVLLERENSLMLSGLSLRALKEWAIPEATTARMPLTPRISDTR